MEQRPLRLGDLVDDYCPRERRVTNHAIVAIVDDAIRTTRCTTCETEHVFKAGRLPRRRVKDSDVVEAAAETNGQPVSQDEPEVAAPIAAAADETVDAPVEPEDDANGNRADENGWPANRTLLRAKLPRVEGEQPPPRPIPEFTIYQRHNSRSAGGFRRGGGGGGGGWGRGGGGSSNGGNGQEPNGNRTDYRGNRNGGGPGFGGGPGPGGGGGRRRHGKRRPR
jgi:uncharacterized membrane protein YgcG